MGILNMLIMFVIVLRTKIHFLDHNHAIDRKIPLCKRTILQDAETMQLDALRTHLQLSGENSLYVAKLYSQLGTLYMYMNNYLVILNYFSL